MSTQPGTGPAPCTGTLDVLSCGISAPDLSLPILREADHIFGSRALLKACGKLPGQKHVITAHAADEAAEALSLVRSGAHVAALASGDALYFGLGGTIASLPQARDLSIRFHPGITAFQALFHRLGLAWNDARLFSAHWKNPPVREMAEANLAVIYGGSRFPASKLAAEIIAFHPPFADRPAVLAEKLGSIDEKLVRGSLKKLAELDCGPTSILLLLPTEIPGPMLALGLPDDLYRKEHHLITASDVRAIILSRLRLPAHGVLWDLGAGSGSVGLEAAALRPGLQVLAVERQPQRCGMIRENTKFLGVANHTLVEGEMPEALDSLPSPDRIFVGGGGKKLPTILERAYAALSPYGLLVVSAITLESFVTLSQWNVSHRIGMSSLDISTEVPLSGEYTYLKRQNRIYIFSFAKN